MYMHNWGMNDPWFINAPYGLGALFGGLMLVILLWSFIWKGLALWHSSRNNQPWWFFAILLVNTFGILEIVYLFGIAKLRFNELFTHGPHHHKAHHHHHES